MTKVVCLVVECLAVWKAISLVVEVGFQNFEVESISLTVVTSLHNDTNDQGLCGHFFVSIKNLLVMIDV